jgi:hypothetical protein
VGLRGHLGGPRLQEPANHRYGNRLSPRCC